MHIIYLMLKFNITLKLFPFVSRCFILLVFSMMPICLSSFNDNTTYGQVQTEETAKVVQNDVKEFISRDNSPYDQRNYTGAIEYYDKALAIDANNTIILRNIGLSLANLERYSEAIEYYDRVLAIDPNHVIALNNKGNTLNELGRYEKAIEQYDKALGSKPIEDIQYSNKDLKTELDYSSVSQPMTFIDFDGYKEFNGLQYIGLSQDSETIIIITVNKGIAQYKQGKYNEANDNFDKALGMDSDYVAALHYKGLCLEKLGQSDQAISYKNRAKAIDPTYKGELIDIVLTQSPLEQLFDTQ